jgi:hypothetical protein
MRRARKPSPALIVAVIALVAAVGGLAVAAVPDRQGRITSCYAKKSGKLRVLVRGTACRRTETRLRWNQTGPPGATGAVGATGATGATGQTGATGSSASSMLTAGSMNIAAVVGETRYMHPSGGSDFFGDVNFADTLSPNQPVVAHDLAVRLGNPAGANESYEITLVVEDVETALGCTVAGDTATACSDSTARVEIPAGTKIAFAVEVSGGAFSRRVQFGWRATQP